MKKPTSIPDCQTPPGGKEMNKHETPTPAGQVEGGATHNHNVVLLGDCIADCIRVTKNCVARIDLGRVVARQDALETVVTKSSWTLCHFRRAAPPRVKVSMALNHHTFPLSKGKRDDMVQLTDKYGEPSAGLATFIALRSQEVNDIITALFHEYYNSPEILGMAQRIGILDSAKANMKNIETDIEILKSQAASNFEIFKVLAGQFIVDQIEKGQSRNLEIWHNAAGRVIDQRNIVKLTGNKPENTPEARVLAAVQTATAACYGIAHKAKVREVLNSDGGPTMNNESFRTKLATVGFDWLPSLPEWEKNWLPIAESLGLTQPDL